MDLGWGIAIGAVGVVLVVWSALVMMRVPASRRRLERQRELGTRSLTETDVEAVRKILDQEAEGERAGDVLIYEWLEAWRLRDEWYAYQQSSETHGLPDRLAYRLVKRTRLKRARIRMARRIYHLQNRAGYEKMLAKIDLPTTDAVDLVREQRRREHA